jgi:hypothetical protein
MRRSARTVLCGGCRAIGIPTATAKLNPLISTHTFDTSPFARTRAGRLHLRAFPILTRISPFITLALPPEHPQFQVTSGIQTRHEFTREKGASRLRL